MTLPTKVLLKAHKAHGFIGAELLRGTVMLSMRKIALCTLILASSPFLSWAEPTEEPDKAYFTIQDTVRKTPEKKEEKIGNPAVVLYQGMQAFAEVARTASINLLKWKRHEGAPPAPSEPYNRKKHFGGWVNDKHDDTCYSTRVKVLIRDSKTEVKFKDNNHCMVDTGTWDDPYTGTQITNARDVDIDHVVPLKNAFDSGAWTWDFQKRCLYANFAANPYHLKAVDFLENRTKGQQGPDEYLPKNSRYTCEYLQVWLKIKLVWGLEMQSHEARAIETALEKFNCEIKDYKMSQKELAEQRKATVDLQKICEAKNLQIQNNDSDMDDSESL